MNATKRYQWACENPSDISLLIPKLREYGEKVKTVTEFGVRAGVSTSAWLVAGIEKLSCYDQNIPECLPEIQAIAAAEKIDFKFTQADTGNVLIEETELLFIDTLHNAAHVWKEVGKNCDRVSKYIAFHDTFLFWENGEFGDGLKKFMDEFLATHPEWVKDFHTDICNGLTILKKK